MVLSKREKLILIVTTVSIGVLMLDSIFLSPLLEHRSKLYAEKQRLLAELDQAETLSARQRRLASEWQSMLDSGLRTDRAAAESRVLHALRNWSQQAGFTITSVRPERTVLRNGLNEITFQASGSGTMSAIAGFIWRLESSELPIRVANLQLGTRREGTENLTLQLRVSALFADAPHLQETGQ